MTLIGAFDPNVLILAQPSLFLEQENDGRTKSYVIDINVKYRAKTEANSLADNGFKRF